MLAQRKTPCFYAHPLLPQHLPSLVLSGRERALAVLPLNTIVFCEWQVMSTCLCRNLISLHTAPRQSPTAALDYMWLIWRKAAQAPSNSTTVCCRFQMLEFWGNLHEIPASFVPFPSFNHRKIFAVNQPCRQILKYLSRLICLPAVSGE